jgi:hypothetical protein
VITPDAKQPKSIQSEIVAKALRSQFVTVIAWGSLIFAGTVGSLSALSALLGLVKGSGGLLSDIAVIAYSALSGWSALALLRRQEWGRLSFIVLTALSTAYSWTQIPSAAHLSKSVIALLGSVPAEMQDQIDQVVQTLSQGVMAILVVVTITSVWIIIRLMSAEIKREFSA